MENIEFSPIQLSLAGEISVSQKNNILTDRIILQISGRKQIIAQTVINGTTVHCDVLILITLFNWFIIFDITLKDINLKYVFFTNI